MLEILVTLLAVSLVYIAHQRQECKKISDSRNLWFEIAKDFAKELHDEKQKVRQMHEDLLDENRF